MSNHKPSSLCYSHDSCLVIIDVQLKLTTAMPESMVTLLRKNIDILIQAAKPLDIPIITTAQYPTGLGPIEESISSQLDNSSRHFDKTCFSILGEPQLLQHLKETNKKQIILTGIEAHICVLQSAFELLQHGFDVYVTTDAITSRKQNNYEIALTRLKQAGCQLISTESVLFEWLRNASHPDFKILSKLIR